MAALKLSELQAFSGGVLTGDAAFERVITDSRQVQAGDLFVAINGERMNGNDYAATALSDGAAAVLVDASAPALEGANLRVDDTQLALGQLAALNRSRFEGRVIGLTGSAGKTSCKEMIAAIFAQQHKVLATVGNRNNEIGMPLTLLDLAPEHQVAVIEMGAAKAGDIDYLCQFSQPQIALLTNAAPAHLEGFGSLEGVAETKGEIFDRLGAEDWAVINADDQFSARWYERAAQAQRIRFGFSEAADVRAENILSCAKGSRFELCYQGERWLCDLSLLGRHNVMNALAAAAVAFAGGASGEEIVAGLASIRPVPGRLCPQEIADWTVIDDSYNANPSAVKAAIEVLAQFESPRALLLGQMGELGPDSAELHAGIGRFAAEQGIEHVLVTGVDAGAVVSAFEQVAGQGQSAEVLENTQVMAERVAALMPAGNILVKGSRSAAMERAIEALADSREQNNGGQR